MLVTVCRSARGEGRGTTDCVTVARAGRNWSAATTRCSLRHTGEQRSGDSSRSPADTQLTPGGSVTRHTSGFRLNIFFIGVSGK